MSLFKLQNKTIQSIKESSFDLEKDIQKIVEENLEKIFGLKFISSEFIIQGLRIDTLAYDSETQSFVIIEYKRDRSFSVIDQGFAYLSLLLNHPDSFILEYAKKTNTPISKINIDKTQSKVIFISSSFTIHQQNAINFRDLPIELWEVKKYEDSILEFDQLKSPDANASILNVTKNKTIETVSREVKKYTTDDHFKEGWEKTKELYEIIQEKILNLDNRFVESPQKYYIGFKIGNQIVVGIETRKSKLIVSLNRTQPKDIKDPEQKARYRKNSYKYYNKHITDYDVINREDIDYGIFLIKQVYEKFYK